MWIYQGKEFTSDMIGDYIGFVYIITNKANGMKYIGKKTLLSKRKLKPLKGKTRRRTKITESDWKEYYGSSDEVKALVEEFGSETFEREILHLCKTKGEMSYLELYEQVNRNVLFDDTYYNGIIQVRVHRNHVKDLKEKLTNLS